MCIKSGTHTSSSNIETTHDVCKSLQNQKIHNTKIISIKVYKTNTPPKLVTSKTFFPLTLGSPPKSITPLRKDIQFTNFSPFLTRLSKDIKSQKDLTGDRQKIDIEGTRRTRNHKPTRKRETWCYGHKGKKKDAKHVKNNACKRISIDRKVSRSYRADLDGLNSYREAIKGTGTFLIDPPWCEPQSIRFETQQKLLEYLPKKAKIQNFDRNPDPTFIIETRTKGISITPWPNDYNWIAN